MTAATLIWGSIPIFAILCSLPSPIFVFFRVLFGLPFVVVLSLKYIGKQNLLNPKPFLWIFLSGVALSLNWIFFFFAIQITDVATAVILYYFGPVFTIILAVVFLKEPLTKRVVISTIVAFFGAILTIAPSFEKSSNITLSGIFVSLLASLFYGLLGFFSKLATKHHKPIKITTYQLAISIVFTLPFVFFLKFTLNTTTILLLIVTGTIHTALALFLWYDSLNFITVSEASVLSYLDPFFAIALSFIIFGQKPLLLQIIGGIFIAIGGIIVSIQDTKRKLS